MVEIIANAINDVFMLIIGAAMFYVLAVGPAALIGNELQKHLTRLFSDQPVQWREFGRILFCFAVFAPLAIGAIIALYLFSADTLWR